MIFSYLPLPLFRYTFESFRTVLKFSSCFLLSLFLSILSFLWLWKVVFSLTLHPLNSECVFLHMDWYSFLFVKFISCYFTECVYCSTQQEQEIVFLLFLFLYFNFSCLIALAHAFSAVLNGVDIADILFLFLTVEVLV